MILQLALTVALAVTPSELESSAQKEVARKFEKVGRSTPKTDDALTRAARILANLALTTKAAEVADLVQISDAVSAGGGWDPSPRALVMRSSPPEYALESLKAREDLDDEPAGQMGVGAAVDGDRGAIVVLLAERKATLKPFPHSMAKAGETQTLCGETVSSLSKTEIYVTSPEGQVNRVPLTRDQGSSFCTSLTFPKEGRYTVEIIGRGARGPEVAALFFEDVGKAARVAIEAKMPEPTTVEAARAAVIEKINALRRAHGLKTLSDDPALDSVAQGYSERMARENFFSHVAPDGQDMRARLRGAGYIYKTAGENLGTAGGPLAAHFGIEHSPGHRRNLLDPAYTNVGVGVVFEQLQDRVQVIVTELLALPDRPSSDPLADAYELLSDARKAKGLSPMQRSEVLEQIAFSHAKAALSEDNPKATLPGHTPVHERVFTSTDFKSAAVDVFVAESLTALTATKNALDPKTDRVGIGAVKGDSKTLGAGKYWVVVIYAASR